jgi:hypothetical protein
MIALLTKFKWYLIAFAVVAFFAMIIIIDVQRNNNAKLRAKNDRLNENIGSLLDDNVNQTALILSKDEVIGQIKRERDSIAKELKIKPKQVDKIVTEYITVRDTVETLIPVDVVNDTTWTFVDQINACTLYQGEVSVSGNSLQVKRLLFQEDNELTTAYYRVRPHKFWFFKWGKWINKVQIVPKCGTVKTESFQFLK